MQHEPPQVRVAVTDEVAVVELSGTFLDEIAILDAGQKLAALVIKTDRPRLILDFDRVSHLSSTMVITMLTSLHKKVSDKGGELRLCSIPPEIFAIFQIAQLDEVFQIHQSRADAVEGICG